MKKNVVIMGMLMVLLIGGLGSGFALSDNNGETDLWGSSAVEEGKIYTIEEMLTYAIQDEYSARAEYYKIMDVFQTTRPFSNIVKAEETHVRELEPLFFAYDISLPKDEAALHLILPDTLQETYAIGVEAEIHNIAMYNQFLKQELPEDIHSVFVALRDASEKHLSAFENAVNRTTGSGRFGRR